jgi:putative tricarboxylic transport membrane protein
LNQPVVERLLNLFWILLGSGGAWHAWTLGLRGPSGPESGLFPFIASCAIACLGLALMATRRSAASNPQWPDAGAGLRAAGVAVGIALMAFGMDRIGFVAAAAMAMPVLLRTIDRASWLETVLLTAGAIAAIVLIFGRLLGMPLPRGPWGW